METIAVADDVFALCAPAQRPFGLLYFNSFVIKSKEPVLVDTHTVVHGKEFLRALRDLIDPADVRWIILTHDDRDHSGNLLEILELCPQARLVTSWLSIGRLSEECKLPFDRVQIVNPGDRFCAGDREFLTTRPPLFDSPGTNAFFDSRTRILFSSDAFGAVVPSIVEDVAAVPADDYVTGFNLFNTANHAWFDLVDPKKFALGIERIRALDPAIIASSHAPPARGQTARLLAMMAEMPRQPPYSGLSQVDLERLRANGMFQ